MPLGHMYNTSSITDPPMPLYPRQSQPISKNLVNNSVGVKTLVTQNPKTLEASVPKNLVTEAQVPETLVPKNLVIKAPVPETPVPVMDGFQAKTFRKVGCMTKS